MEDSRLMIPNTFKKLAFFFTSPLYISMLLGNSGMQDQFIVAHAITEVPYTINSDLVFEPHHSMFYQAMDHELKALQLRFGTKDPIDLSHNQPAQSLAPKLFKLLSTKTQTIAIKMGLDIASVNICIQPTKQEVSGIFNAHAQTSIQVKVTQTSLVQSDGTILDTKIDHTTSCSHNLTLNAESLKLLLWYEGTEPYHEGLLDGVIAHELAHIFHGHMECGIECEYQADTTGAKSLQNPHNVINAVDLLYFAGNLYANLTQTNLPINNETIFYIINIIGNTFMHTKEKFGYFSQCSSHIQFSHKIQQAINKALARINMRKASNDTAMITSLLYDEIKDAAYIPLPSTNSEATLTYQALEHQISLYSQQTHPDPLSRRNHLYNSLR